MKCNKCGGKAIINMPQHHLGLCREHYLDWIPEQTERFIKKYGMFSRGERILVAVSGGKDSLSLWDILHRLGYQVDGLYICLGIAGDISYSSESQRLTENFAAKNGLNLHVVNVEHELGVGIPEISRITFRGQQRPCSACGLVKRHEMNRIARDNSYDVLATGHNLDDEAAVLFGNTLAWAGEYLLRQGPVLPGNPGLVRKVKPLCRFYEREMTAYAILRDIEYIYDECPYAVGSTSIYYKELLNQMENERHGVKLTFYLNFLEARKRGLFVENGPIRQELHACPECKQPTSAPGLCSYCRMKEKITSNARITHDENPQP
jgi:tRNA-5-methyluridine54 2-sulfurtransferase